MPDPKSDERTGKFVGVKTGAAQKPKPEASGFRLKLSVNGRPIGYVGLQQSGWCVVSDNGLLWNSIPGSDNFVYYQIQSGRLYGGFWLTVSDNANVGVYYSSDSAVGWQILSDHTMTNNYNNQKLTLYSAPFLEGLYAWDAYQVLTVEEEVAG